MKKNILLFLIIGIIAFSVMVMIVLKVLNLDNNWVGLWGSILGSIIGGLFTFIVLDKTINFESNDRREERRLSIMPYFRYEIVEFKEIIGKYNEEIGVRPHHELMGNLKRNEDGTLTYKYDLEFSMIIENIGLNAAKTINILQVKYCGLTDLSYREFFALKVGEKIAINISMIINLQGRLDISRENGRLTPLEMKIAYVDLMNNYYEQDIKLWCDVSWKCEEEYGYSASYNSKSFPEPIYYEDKKINVERKKYEFKFTKK